MATQRPFRARTFRPRRRRGGPRRGRVELGEVLEEVLNRRVPTEVQRLARLRNLWIELLPTSFADHVWPMLVQGSRLIVHVHDSQWLHEMTYWRQDVLTRLRAAWPESGVSSLEAYVSALPPLHERRPPAPASPAPVERVSVLPSEVPQDTLEALKAVRDPQLRELLARARVRLGEPR